MSHSEHPSKGPRIATGRFPVLRASLTGAGRSGFSVSAYGLPRRKKMALACWLAYAISMSVVLAIATPALASNSQAFGSQLSVAPFFAQPPEVRGELYQEYVSSTRATVVAEVELYSVGNAPWHVEYSTSLSGPWTPAGGGILPGGGGGNTEFVCIGATDLTSVESYYCVLHHLTPETKYYARFAVEDAGGTASRTFEFTTLAVGVPEIAKKHNEATNSSTFEEFGDALTATSQQYRAQIETNGAASEYHLEYTSEPGNISSWKTFTSSTVSVAEDYADPEFKLTDLQPETLYSVRLRVSNAKGDVEETRSFNTRTLRPVVGRPEFRNIKTTSVHLATSISPNGTQTEWRYEYTTEPENSSSWKPIAGQEGIISQVQAEALPEGYGGLVEGLYSGLSPATRYCVRVHASNKAGEALGSSACFETAGPPIVATNAVHALRNEAIRLLGSVNPDSIPTSAEQTITVGGAPTGGTFTLTFDGQTTAPIAFDAPAEGPGSVSRALESLPGEPPIYVRGFAGGPYTLYFGALDTGKAEPQITADASGLTPSGSVAVTTTQEGGEIREFEYRFEYVKQEQYEQSGFKEAESTPEQPVAPGNGLEFFGEDVPGLRSGQTYRYRLAVSSASPGTPAADGAVQQLRVPAAAPAPASAACPNAQFRTGASANLPDCRAYELLTPVDKEGAQEAYNYGPRVVSGALVGEDGEHAAFEDPAVNWGPGPDAGQSPYFFNREEAQHGWKMLAGASQPEAGVQHVEPQLYNDDLTQVALATEVHTSHGAGESKEVQFRVGPAGGPYTLVASVPRNQAESQERVVDRRLPDEFVGWVAASGDFSKLILAVEDHALVEPHTQTKAGEMDLYEYSDGRLSQVNVGTGTCGAHIAQGWEPGGQRSSVHTVSADGSHVFFEAVPGSNCGLPEHLFMRVNGTETVDLGAYRFAGANAQGTEILLEGDSGRSEYFIEDVDQEHPTPKEIFSTAQPVAEMEVSSEFAAIYFRVGNELYRYDLKDEALSELFQMEQRAYTGTIEGRSSPDGRFYYFHGNVAGVPAGGQDTSQMFLYDSAENVVECVSCSSSFDPEPKLGAFVPGNESDLGPAAPLNGYPDKTFLSADGDYAFFDTPAALLSSDVDGEVAPTPKTQVEFQSEEFSPSSDVYEWRRDGIDGCGQIQGCLALITNGRGGFLNLLIGASPTGSNVFIYTRSQLLLQDNDNSGDIYDARVDGGFPSPAPASVECEGDACSTPASPPNDATPSSLTFSGEGNVAQPAMKLAVRSAKSKPKKKKKASKKRRKSRAKKSAKAKRSAGRSNVNRRRATRTSGRGK